MQIAARPENKGKVIVTIIPSYTERYLSTLLAEEERKQVQELAVSPVDDKWVQRVDELFKAQV